MCGKTVTQFSIILEGRVRGARGELVPTSTHPHYFFFYFETEIFFSFTSRNNCEI